MPDQTIDDMMKSWRDLTLQNWSWMSQQWVESDVFMKSMEAACDVGLATHKRVREGVEQSLAALDFPTRSDMARLSAQVQAAETRSLDCDERLERIEAQLERMATRQESLLGQMAERIETRLREAQLVAEAAAARTALVRESSAPPAAPANKVATPKQQATQKKGNIKR